MDDLFNRRLNMSEYLIEAR